MDKAAIKGFFAENQIEVTKGKIRLPGTRLRDWDSMKADFLDNYSSHEAAIDFFRLPIKERMDLLKEIEASYKVRIAENNFPRHSINPESYLPLVETKTGQIFMYSLKVKKLSGLSYDAWAQTMDKDTHAAIMSQKKLVSFNYDPYNIDVLGETELDGTVITRVNTYHAPEWRHLNSEPSIPDNVDLLLKHLFPIREQREMVLDWMSIAIMGRNETYLVLNGRKGIGKGVFCELLSSLVGRENYSEAPKSLLTSQFNASLDQKRLLIFDEFKVGKSEHSLLKRYINRFQAIEKKGIDALNAVETYNSFIISNNDLTDMYVEYDDRRLSIPDLNTKDFSSALSKEDIKQFLKDMESAEFIAPFGQYLVDRYAGAKEKSFNYISGKRFNELVYNSLHDWKKFLVGKILSNEFARYKISALRREFTAEGKTYFPTDPRKIEEFFVNYKHDGRQIAEVVIENGRDSYLHPIKEDDAF